MKVKTKVVIFLEGGLVQTVLTNKRGVEVTVVDLDTEGSEGWERLSFKRADGTGLFESCPHMEKAHFCPRRVSYIIKTVKGFIRGWK